MSTNPESVLDIVPGTNLKLEESAAIEEVIGTFIDQVYGERLTEDHLDKDLLMEAIDIVMKSNGYQVELNVPYHSLGITAVEGYFDIVARTEDDISIMSICEGPSETEIERLNHQASVVAANIQSSRFLLATDILNSLPLLSGPISREIQGLMTEKNLGVLLIDHTIGIMFDNQSQLLVDEMPTFIYRRG